MEQQNMTATSQEHVAGEEIDYPVNISLAYPDRSSRLLALLTLLFLVPKFLILLPHYVALYFLGLVSFFVWVISQFAVLFTGKFPKGMHGFQIGVLRWQTRLAAYLYGLTDKYPPFRLGE